LVTAGCFTWNNDSEWAKEKKPGDKRQKGKELAVENGKMLLWKLA